MNEKKGEKRTTRMRMGRRSRGIKKNGRGRRVMGKRTRFLLPFFAKNEKTNRRRESMEGKTEAK